MLTDQDLSNYVWTESSGDVPVNMAWVIHGQKSVADSSTLMMKVRQKGLGNCLFDHYFLYLVSMVTYLIM